MEFSARLQLWSPGGAVAAAEGLWLVGSSGFCPCAGCEQLQSSAHGPGPMQSPGKSLTAPLALHPSQEGFQCSPLSASLPSDVRGSFVWFRTAEHWGISLCSSQEHFVGLLKSLCIGCLIYILFSSKTLIWVRKGWRNIMSRSTLPTQLIINDTAFGIPF